MSATTPTDQLRVALADRYRIERELGMGGMATVYLAHDQRHDRKVAIKVLKPELAAVLGAERFVVEIKTTASLQHPHILPLFDSGTADGFLFYVMPYIQGETIREKLNRETQFGVDEALRIAREVADALDYAHRHGVIHRDIKPENLLLHDGRAMVMDFGIALAVSAAAGGRMTETGLSLGTPHYMSPEQATAEKEITGRTDVYSLASVLYEMLTGEPPHMGNSAQQIIMKIITETPQPVTTLRKSVPPNVAAAVAKALEKLPADRFESAKAFSDALQNPAFATARTGVLAAGDTRRRSAQAWALAAASLATLAIGYVAGRGAASTPDPRVVQFLVEPPDSILGVNRCCGPAQVLSPDGSTLVYVGMRPDGSSLYRRSLDRLTSERIPGTDNATIPFFSPDGQWVAFEADGHLKKISMSGGPALPIAAIGSGEVSGGSWGDDDVIVFTQRGVHKLSRVPAAGGKPTLVPVSDSTVQLLYPFVLPGAKHALVSVRRTSAADEWRIGVVDLGSGAVEQLGSATRVQYANGSIVYAGMDNTLLAQSFDLRSRKTTGQAMPIATGVSLSGNVMHEFSLSTNGLLEYEVGRGDAGEQLRVIGAGAGITITVPGRRETNLEDPAISPDGRHIVLRLPAVNADFGDLWIIDRQNGTLNRLTVGGGAAPSWSRDGRFIAYYAPGDSTVKAGIYVRPIDQPDATLVRAGHNMFPGSWLPDGRSITFNTNDPLNSNPTIATGGGSFDIGKVTLGDTAVTWLVKTQFSEAHPQVSPDGRLLAYISNRSGRREVYVQPLTGGGVPAQVSSEGATSPRWSRDSRTVFYVSTANSIIGATIGAGAGITIIKRTEIASRLGLDLNPPNVNWDLLPDDKPVVIDGSGGQGRRRMALVQNWPAIARALGEGAKR